MKSVSPRGGGYLPTSKCAEQTDMNCTPGLQCTCAIRSYGRLNNRRGPDVKLAHKSYMLRKRPFWAFGLLVLLAY